MQDETTGIEEETHLPLNYRLFQNYPNPFNPATRISYRIPGETFVELVIYNSLGQVMRTLVSGLQAEGFYNVLWDGRSDEGTAVSSGIYIYSMNAGSFSSTRKMILIK